MIEPQIENMYDGTYHVQHRCGCLRVTEAMVTGPELFAWRQGAFVQDAFPSLSVDEREALFVTGICATCWDEMLGDED